MRAVIGQLKTRVRTVMNEGAKTSFPFTAAVLEFAARGYREAVLLRARRYARGRLESRRLPCRVVSVGNLTVGGTGKTPMTLYLAGLIKGLGLGVAVVSRGYRGRAEHRGGIVSDGRRVVMGPEEAGDEPFMLATVLKGVPVVVGQDRYRAGLRAIEAFGSDILLLDDAFQHLQLSRDLNIVLLDGGRPLGNGHLLPRGPLREPVFALKRADAIVLTRCQEGRQPGQWPDMGAGVRKIPLFRSTHVPRGCWIKAGAQGQSSRAVAPDFVQDERMLGGRRVLAFSGIAGNRGFCRTVRGLGGSVRGFVEFDDHHAYTRSDCRELCRRARELKIDVMATTYKDYVKISHFSDWPVDLAVVDIRLSLGLDAPGFDAFVRRRLTAVPPR